VRAGGKWKLGVAAATTGAAVAAVAAEAAVASVAAEVAVAAVAAETAVAAVAAVAAQPMAPERPPGVPPGLSILTRGRALWRRSAGTPT